MLRLLILPLLLINSNLNSYQVIYEPLIPKPYNVHYVADSLCKVFKVPYKLVYTIGKQESNWNFNKVGKYGDRGDLQVIPNTFKYWYNKLNLKGGKTRTNYLIVGIAYLRYQYDIYHNWRKARYAYGRGSWKEPFTISIDSITGREKVDTNWTKMEFKFMNF